MKKLLPVIAALCLAGNNTAGNAASGALKSAVDADYAYILDLYKHFHQNPELSFKESKSAARMQAELEPLGFTVTTGVGDAWAKQKARTAEGELIDGVGGYGLVAVMENGEGPTVMLRADMDALPLQEKTGLDYASTVTDIDYRGVEAPVMHACAHDSHMAILIGAARQLAAIKDQWAALQGETADAETPLPAPLHAEPPLRILLAEDNSVNQMVALQMLRKLGFSADVASDGTQALALVQQQDYDVVLMDIQMPEMDGLTASKLIREAADIQQPYIVAMTANALSTDRDDCLAAGMDDFVPKPVRIGEIQAALRRAAAAVGAVQVSAAARAAWPESATLYSS